MKEASVANIEALLGKATKQEIQQGKRWYSDANKFAQSLSKKYKLSLDIVSAVIAILSPSNPWERNKSDTENLIVAYQEGKTSFSVKVTTYNVNKQKAWSVLDGSREVNRELFGEGLKTYNFYLCIRYPNKKDAVCIDGHMINAMMYGVEKRETITKAPNVRRNYYNEVANIFIETAIKHGYTPNHFQAVIWLVYRNLNLSPRMQYSISR